MRHYSVIEKSHSDRFDEIGTNLGEMRTMEETGTRDWKHLNLMKATSESYYTNDYKYIP